MIRRRARVAARERRGAAIVETAVVLPVFLIMVFGMIECGRAMMVSQVVTNASREGARVASANDGSNARVSARVKEYLSDALGIPQNVINVQIDVSPGGSPPTNAGAGGWLDGIEGGGGGGLVEEAEPGDRCTVRVSIPFNSVALWQSGFLQNATLRGYCSMRHEW